MAFLNTPGFGSSPRGRGTPPLGDGLPLERRFIPAWAGNTSWARRSSRSPSVHPRVGGEHQKVLISTEIQPGSSPRGRGTHRLHNRVPPAERFIPAWAGNTHRYRRIAPERTVHPRVGGEHIAEYEAGDISTGSSPRGRGTRLRVEEIALVGRFIPAWAGNTYSRPTGSRPPPVHPRVGGEHATPVVDAPPATGSSPRGRGTHRAGDAEDGADRFIPAWAGNTRSSPPWFLPPPVHPRVGGEHIFRNACSSSNDGSSPRGRGTLRARGPQVVVGRFIPAWAGNTYRSRRRAIDATVHPRVGGEHYEINPVPSAAHGSSPRGRGTPSHLLREMPRLRFIPAWAGNTSAKSKTRCESTVHPAWAGNTCAACFIARSHSVHPRVGGEHLAIKHELICSGGSSPRGRGTQSLAADDSLNRRFIPAWAGNTSSRSIRRESDTVHPRVGGEHPERSGDVMFQYGSSPRGRGTPEPPASPA